MTPLFYESKILSVAIMLFLILLPRIAFGQTSINHTIPVTVSPVSIIRVLGGDVTINITGADATAGVDQMTSAPNDASTLIWGTNSTPRKITISTNLTPQTYTLKAEARSPSVGSAVGEVTLSTAAYDYDFITDVGRTSGNAVIRYTGIALASKGIGTDSHSITFTITP